MRCSSAQRTSIFYVKNECGEINIFKLDYVRNRSERDSSTVATACVGTVSLRRKIRSTQQANKPASPADTAQTRGDIFRLIQVVVSVQGKRPQSTKRESRRHFGRGLVHAGKEGGARAA